MSNWPVFVMFAVVVACILWLLDNDPGGPRRPA